MNKKIKIQVVGGITPFDKENVENLNDMSFKLDTKRKINIVSDEVGKRGFLK